LYGSPAVSTPALRPLGIGEILDVSLKIAWRNFGTLARIVLLVVLPAQVLIAIVSVSAIPDFDPNPFASGNELEEDEVWTFLAASSATLVIAFLAGQFATGACFRAVAESYLGRETDWRSSLGFAARRFLSILWIVVLGGILTAVGFLFCVVPGIYLYVCFAVALPVLMSEGQRGSNALRRSRALVRGRWWKTALALLVAGLLAFLLAGIIETLVATVSFVDDDNAFVLFLVTAIAGTAGALVSTPFSAAYHTVLYFDLRVRKEGFDLQLLASRLGVEPSADWTPPAPPPAPAAQAPYWPPPPGRTPPETPAPEAPEPPEASEPREAPEQQGGEKQPPFWPPPPGWKPE
jgi:hypothetical protein